MALVFLEELFLRVLVASDGVQGLQLFREHAPDIVLSDHIMPGLSGVEMAREIRRFDQHTSIILMTASIDHETLIEAINLGVNRFIPKPLDPTVLERIFAELIRELVDRRELGKCRLQELELLRDRDRYHSIQQETARRKERHVVRHDLRDKLVAGGKGSLWGIKVTHAPRDIMCGDGYTIRTLFDGRQLIFLVDAMGSGLSASLSALLATSFCNYQVDHLHQWHTFNLQLFLMRFQEYLGGILLDEEALSCGFLLVDLAGGELEMAMFGLPPMLVRGLDGSVRRIPGANPPLCIHSAAIDFAALSLAEVADLMIMTDGVTDASLHGGGTYRERLDRDFSDSPTLESLLRLFALHTESEERDDRTLLQLQRLDLPAAWSWRSADQARTGQPAATAEKLVQDLSGRISLSSRERSDLETAVGLALAGALACPPAAAEREAEGFLPQALQNTPRQGPPPSPSAAGSACSASLWLGAGRPLLTVEIVDNGPDAAVSWRKPAEDRSLERIAPLCDAVFVGGEGRRLLLLKTIEGGAVSAH